MAAAREEGRINKSVIQNFVRDYSIETTVPQAERVGRFDALVAPGTRIYLPHTPRMTLQDAVGLAVRLRREHMEPVPHIVARRIENLSVLNDFLARLTTEAGVRQVLVVAGDSPKAAGELWSTLEILDSGLLEKHNIRTIGVGGHPEGHRDVPDPVLRDALQKKNAYAQKTGANVYIVTQFTFSAQTIIGWEASNSDAIGQLPITAGLPGLATAKTLLKYAIECGIGASLQAFSKRYVSLTKLLTISTPDQTIVALAAHKDRTPQSRLTGVHFFTFGGFQKTADWANKIVSGDFELTGDGSLQTQL